MAALLHVPGDSSRADTKTPPSQRDGGVRVPFGYLTALVNPVTGWFSSNAAALRRKPRVSTSR